MLEPALTEARVVRPGRSRVSTSLVKVVVLAVVALVVVGWLAAAVFALLHVVELLAVAFFTGWAGYQVGVRQGRRQARPR